MNEVALISVDAIDIEALSNIPDDMLTDEQFAAVCAHCENELNQLAARIAAVQSKLEVVRRRRASIT